MPCSWGVSVYVGKFPYNDGKIGCNFYFQLKVSIEESIFCWNCLNFGLELMVCDFRLCLGFVSIYDVIMVHQVPGYSDYDVL